MEKKIFYINLHLKVRLDIEFELMPEEALTLFTVYDAYRYIYASVIEVRK